MGERMTDEELDLRCSGRVLATVGFDGYGAGAPGRVVLQVNPGNVGSGYAVHWQNAQTGGRHNGGYHDRLSEALRDFAERVAREETYARARGDLPLELRAPGDQTGPWVALYDSGPEDSPHHEGYYGFFNNHDEARKAFRDAFGSDGGVRLVGTARMKGD